MYSFNRGVFLHSPLARLDVEEIYMKKYLLAGCLLFCTPAPNGPIASVHSKEEIYAGAIAVKGEDGSFVSVGTGVYVKSAVGKGILTAKHVAVISNFTVLYICNMRVTICDPLDRKYLSSSSDSLVDDWAFFSQENSFLSPMRASTKYKIKDDVTVIGMSWGDIPWVSKGNISWVEDNMLLVNAYCAPGCSGGPVLDKNDRLIGIISALNVSEWGPQNNQLFVVPVDNIDIIK